MYLYVWHIERMGQRAKGKHNACKEMTHGTDWECVRHSGEDQVFACVCEGEVAREEILSE